MGGNRRDLNRFTICEECHAALVDGRPAAEVDLYLGRFRELVRRVTATQGAVEGYVNVARSVLDGPDGIDSHHQARDEVRTEQRLLREALTAVRSLPDSKRPPSETLRREHERWVDRWERWLDVGVEFVDRTDAVLRAERSGVYDCPECGAGIWLDDDFCHSCGVDVSPHERLEADARRVRRRSIEMAQALDGREL
jgi:hypothetical protein